jgi:hypothetical protein
MGAVDKAWDAVSVSFDRFCLTAGIEALGTMMEKDAEQACGARHARSDGRRGHRWGRTQGKIGFHAGKVAVERPRVRDVEGHELALPSWERAVAEDWLGKWAMNLMLYRRGNSAERCGFPRATFPRQRGPEYRSRQLRGTSWRCRLRA